MNKHINKQEKAFKQLIAIVGGFTICFLPYFLLFLFVAICKNCLNEHVYTFAIWLGYFNSTINPFLYALSNKNYKHRQFQSTSSIITKNSVIKKNCSSKSATETILRRRFTGLKFSSIKRK